MNLNKKIRYLREKNSLAQSQIADLLNKSRPTVAGYESGDREPDLETLKKIAVFFNVSTDYLLFDERDIEIEGGYISENTVEYSNDVLDEIDNKRILEKHSILTSNVDKARRKMNKAIKNNDDEKRRKWNKKYREALIERKLFEQSEEYQAFYKIFLEEIRREALKKIIEQ
ncbi:helix-turn-helix domain-containing protein [Clostridium haemolyticum]|uniref:helix-turn-helix domain-containing protein n=1 Tax=Clostridium haemolyticum TaxID=84025 RepID=UPI0006892E09|nr:helix-turn-helix domain-containing protein [Clostridium haemolyticum]